MRLLHIITALHTGGAERILAELSHHWAGQAQLHVAYLKPIATLAGKFHPDTVLHEIGLDLGTAGRLRRLMKDLRPDVVHTHLGHADLLGLWAARNLPMHRWCTLHNARFKPGKGDEVYQTLYKMLLTHLAPDTQAVAISQTVARHAERAWGVSPSRIHVVRNPLAMPAPQLAREEARHRLGLGEEEPVLVFLGRLELQKGITYLLQALAILAQRHVLPHTFIVGEGTLGPILKKEADTLGLAATGRLRFTGLSSEPGLYLAAADMLLLPSLFEGLGNVVAEAFAFGLPVVASNLEGPAEIIEPGRTGLLVPPANPAALAVAIEGLLADTSLRSQMAQAAKRVAKAWPTPQSYADALLKLYQIQAKRI